MKLDDIINELRKHPEVAYFNIFTYEEALDHYKNELMHDYDEPQLDYEEVIIDINDLSENDKHSIQCELVDYHDTIADLIEKTPYGTIENHPDIRQRILRQAKLNSILKK